jgi:hypothetical protein
MPFGIMVLGSLGTFFGVDLTLAAGGLGLTTLAVLGAIRNRDLWNARVYPRLAPVATMPREGAAQTGAAD